jgi:hypothetical protein
MDKMSKIDKECWNCIELDGEDGFIICLKRHDLYNKISGRCPDYDWDEVDEAWQTGVEENKE